MRISGGLLFMVFSRWWLVGSALADGIARTSRLVCVGTVPSAKADPTTYASREGTKTQVSEYRDLWHPIFNG